MKHTILKGLMIGGMFLLFVGLASAFAVSSKHWEENPLTATPGETREFFLVLQNLAGTEDITVQGEITGGQAFTSFSEGSTVYTVPQGEKLDVYLTLAVPENFVVGTEEDIIVSFKTITGGSEGSFSFGTSVQREVPLQIIAEEVPASQESWGTTWTIIALLVILIVVVSFWIYKKRR